MFEKLQQKIKTKTLYALKYSGYTLWWWGSRSLEASLGWASHQTRNAHMWSVGAANQILGKRTRLGQEKEVVQDQAVEEEVARQSEKDYTNAEEALILDEERHNIS